MLFLLGWIPTSSKYRQDVWVEISSQVENGLFTVTGVGLIPWRVVDTYRESLFFDPFDLCFFLVNLSTFTFTFCFSHLVASQDRRCAC